MCFRSIQYQLSDGDGLICSNIPISDLRRSHMWCGTYLEYLNFKILGARFTGAFVREVIVHVDTIEYYVTDSAKLYSDLHMIVARQNEFSVFESACNVPYSSTMTYAMGSYSFHR